MNPVSQSFSKQDKHCKIIYTIFGCIMGIFLLWLIALSIIKSLRGQKGEIGLPGPPGPQGATGPAGATNNTEMQNAKIFYITKDTDFSSSTKVKARSGFILGNGVKSDVTITLPHFSVIGNGATFYIFNQSSDYTLSIKAAKISGQKPAQMSFTSGGTDIKLMPRQFLTIVIMAQQYAIFTEKEKNNKPILHWVSSWNNCGGIPKKFRKMESSEGFNVGPSLKTWGCKNYKKGMDVVQINSTVKNANTLGKNPSDVGSGGIFVVENPNRKPMNNEGEITIRSLGPVNIESPKGLANRRSFSVVPDKSTDRNRRTGLIDRKSSSVILNTAVNMNRQIGSANRRPRTEKKQMSAIQLHKKRQRRKRKKKKQLTEKQKKRKKWLQQRKKESRERRRKAQEKLRMKQMMRGNRRR